MSPFSIKFQANWRKLKIRPFFRTSEISLTHKFYYHHHVQDTRYTLNTNFQANLKKLKIRPFFSDGRNFAHIQILLSPSFSGYLIYPKYKISSQSDKVEISRIQWISCENEKSQNFFIIAIVLRIPDLPHKQNFKLIGQSWKFGRFFGRSKFRWHTNFIITIIFRIPDIPKIQNFKPIGQGWNFANSANFVRKQKIAEFFY